MLWKSLLATRGALNGLDDQVRDGRCAPHARNVSSNLTLKNSRRLTARAGFCLNEAPGAREKWVKFCGAVHTVFTGFPQAFSASLFGVRCGVTPLKCAANSKIVVKVRSEFSTRPISTGSSNSHAQRMLSRARSALEPAREARITMRPRKAEINRAGNWRARSNGRGQSTRQYRSARRSSGCRLRPRRIATALHLGSDR